MNRSTRVDVELREPGSTNVARRLRVAGKLPAVLYGGGRDTRPITVDPKAMIAILQSDGGQNSILTLQLPDDERMQTALISDFQIDPVSHRILHADFLRISLLDPIDVDVPVGVVGEAHGVKIEKGTLDLIMRRVHVRCLPNDIPDTLRIDVTELDIGAVAHVRDLQVPQGVEVLDEADQTLLIIAAPRVEEEIETETLEDDLLGLSEEPELIGEEDGEEGEPGS